MKSATHLSVFLIPVLALMARASADTSDVLKQELAQTYGIEAFAGVESVSFGFNAEIGNGQVFERSWIWEPKMEMLTYIAPEKEPIRFYRYDPGQKGLAAKFVNDVYWLIFPFCVLWDQSAQLSESTEPVAAPLSGEPMRKITVDHPAGVGFTPGDAYDLYLDEDGVVREWVFRKGGVSEATKVSTWEDYEEIDGIRVALDHKNNEGFRVFLENVSFTAAGE